MVAMNTPGVYIQERDMSDIVPSQSNSVTVFSGNFTKGVSSMYTQITSVDELIESYGYPTNDNYNEWYQCYNFLQYGNNLLVSRAINENGLGVSTQNRFTSTFSDSGYGIDAFGTSFYGQGRGVEIIIVSSVNNIKKGDIIGFSDNAINAIDQQKTLRYLVVDIASTEVDAHTTAYAIKLDRELTLPSIATEETVAEWYSQHNKMFKILAHFNGTAEALTNDASSDVNFTWKVTTSKYKDYVNGELVNIKRMTPYNIQLSIPKHLDQSNFISQNTISLDTSTNAYTFEVVDPNDSSDSGVLFNTNKQILNPNDFDLKFSSLRFATQHSKLKFFSKTPGLYDARYKIAIALPRDFTTNDRDHIGNHCTRYAYNGLSIDSFFDYPPADNSAQIAVFIYDTVEDLMKESYIVSLDPEELDSYNNSMFIEKVINRQSNCVYVKCNTDLPATQTLTLNKYDDFGNTLQTTEKVTVPNVGSYTLVCDVNDDYVGHLLDLSCASDSPIQNDDLENAYDIFSNKDELDIDIVIANEIDDGLSAKNLAEKRADCIAFMCIPYEDENGILTVGKKTTESTNNIVKYRNKINYNSMFVSLVANYKYQYDRYNDTYRWLNLAGDVAGLRAQTTENFDTWWASAGLNRGQIKNVQKLAYIPNKTQQGTLYNNGINPIVSFSGDGTVLWGQKTMLTKASSFDRVNVRGLFNTIERALAKMSRYQVMEFNDTFTRNNVIAKISPYLDTIKSGRGITDYKVVCDTTNNTPDIISRNQLIVDVYIKPNYVAEFILLRFTNVGVNDFSVVVTNS